MRKNIITLVVSAMTVFNLSASSRRIVFPNSLDASTIAEIGGSVLYRSAETVETTVKCIVEFSDDALLDELASTYDLQINTATGRLATVIIPVARLTEFASDSDVLRVSVGSSLVSMTDEAARQSNAVAVHTADLSYTGKGVIVGVIDSGFDFGHAAFLDASGQTRVKALWDQNRQAASVGEPSSFGYGIVVDNPDDIMTLAHDYSTDTHGTHVAAIAASSADVYGGMAPDADLVFVSTDKSEAGLADGLKFLIDYADSVGKPLAVNISMGTVIGFKDGTDYLALMIDRLVADNEGVIVSIAAGNEGHRSSTMVCDAAQFSTRLLPPSYNRENLFVGSSSGEFTLTLSLRDENDGLVFSCEYPSESEESVRYDNFTSPSDGSFIALSSAVNTVSGASSIAVNLYAPLQSGWYWEAEVCGDKAKYIMTADYGELSEGSEASTIACTACGYNTISVGAYVSRQSFINLDGQECVNDWTLGLEYSKSGKGPTFDGRNKPDVTAPGAPVISAINSYASSFSVNRSDLVMSRPGVFSDRRTDYWGAMSGTSMATPVVAGIIALWLEADPALTVAEVQEVVAGMDKIDALKGLEALTAGISEVEAESGVSETSVIYDLMGRFIKKLSPATGFDGLAPGMYIIRNGSTCKKVVVNSAL